MPAPRLRSTSSKKRMRRAPKKGTRTLTKAKKPSRATCALCSRPLGGVPRAGVHAAAKMSRTQLRPQRPLGGVLCANCTETIIKEKARLELGALSKADIDMRHHKYLGAIKI